MLQFAREKYPSLRFETADAHSFDAREEFDFIILSDLVNDLWDVQRVFEIAARHSHSGTRIIANFYSHLWQGPRRLAEMIGMAKPQLTQNWLTAEDMNNLLDLAGLEVIRKSAEIMFPFRAAGFEKLFNRYLVKIWPFRWLGITNFIVARPRPKSNVRMPLLLSA